MSEILRDMHRTCRMPHQDDGRGMVSLQPRQCGRQIVLRRRPRMGGGEAVSHVGGMAAAAQCPQCDIVVKRAVTAALVTTHKTAAMHKQQ